MPMKTIKVSVCFLKNNNFFVMFLKYLKKYNFLCILLMGYYLKIKSNKLNKFIDLFPQYTISKIHSSVRKFDLFT